jgi:hypothetical protein
VGFEWETTSPPPTENFLVPPIAVHGAYDYGAGYKGVSEEPGKRPEPQEAHGV